MKLQFSISLSEEEHGKRRIQKYVLWVWDEYECRKTEILDFIFLALLPLHPHFPVAMQTNILSYVRMPGFRAFFQPNQGIN